MCVCDFVYTQYFQLHGYSLVILAFCHKNADSSCSFQCYYYCFNVIIIVSTGVGNGKPLQYSCLENPMNSMKRQKDMILKDETPRSVRAQYATGDRWRNNSSKNEEMEPKQNNTHLWMVLVMEARSNAVRAILHRNLEC